MKLIIKKDAILTKFTYSQYIRLVDNDYILLPDEDILNDVNIIEDCQRLSVIDYRQKRDIYKYLSQDFTGQTSDIQEQICTYCSTTPQVIIPYYMSQGLSYDDSLIKYKNNRAIDIRNACDNYRDTISGQDIALVLVKYLPENELQRFVDETFKLSYLYGNYGIWGKKYNDYIDGIMDFIEDYGSYQGKGLSSYTLYPGTVLQDFIDELKNLLIL